MRVHERSLTVPNFFSPSEQVLYAQGVDYEIGDAIRAREAEISFYHPDAVALILKETLCDSDDDTQQLRRTLKHEDAVFGVAVGYNTALKIGRAGLPQCLGGEGLRDGSETRSAILLACLAVQGQFSRVIETEVVNPDSLPVPRVSHNN